MSDFRFSDHESFISEACHHGQCHRCLKHCQFCNTPCQCDCHDKDKEKVPPGSDRSVREMEREVVAA